MISTIKSNIACNKQIKFFIINSDCSQVTVFIITFQTMGNTLLPPETSSEILNKYWQPVGTNLYRNKATQQVIKQKKMTFRTEDEMKYVFNCLLKRINNYHPNVVKIVYLRKMTESLPLCECGKRFVILVYVECVGKRLKDFVEEQQKKAGDQSQQLVSLYEHKCICMNVLKAAQYLKDRYGAFRVTENNVWINASKNYGKITQAQRNNLQSQSRSQYAHNMVVKLWISSEEEQNFPDQSCQEKQMVLSILELIQHSLLPSRLCKCYPSPQILEKYLTVHRLKELADKIRQDHDNQIETATMTKTLSNVQVINKQHVQFQRTVRSFSSNQPGHHPAHLYTSHQIINQNTRFAAQRKYTSIEHVRKQPAQYNSAVSQKKVSRAPQVIQQVNHFFSPNAKPLLMQQQPPKQHSFQHNKTQQQVIKNDHSLRKNQYKAMVRFQVPQQIFQTQKDHSQSFVQQKSIQPFNPKLKFRHGNSIYSRPIIGIADLSAEMSTNIQSIRISSQQHTPKQQITQKSQSPSVVNQLVTDRDNLLKQNSKVQKINLEEDLSKRHVEISLDKGTNPTDRSKIQISSKSQQKKQLQGINSSRKNISIIPISLDSTNGATQSHKPFLRSQDHIHKPTSSPVSGELEMPNIKQSSIHPEKSKKESGSSSKSEKNYITYQINLVNTKTKEEIGKFVPKKLSTHEDKPKIVKLKVQTLGDAQCQRQKSYSFVNKIQTLSIATPNDMGRLRQSEYIASGQNSLMNSKSISIKESKPFHDDKLFEIGSLQQMEANFPTLKNLDNYEQIGIQRSESRLLVDQEEDLKSNMSHANSNKKNQPGPQIIISQNKPININSHHQSREDSFISKKSNISSIENQKPKSHSFSSTHNNPRAPVPTQQLQHILNDKMSSLILKEQEETMKVQKVTEEYRVKVSSGSEREKMHQKKMSNPTFDKQYMKSKALKEEFSQLLGGQPRENSLKALTESKDKIVNLDRNEGRQTYSIYNESEYNTSQQQSKRQSQHENLAGSGSAHPPLPNKEQGKQTKWRKPLSKEQLQKQLQQKKQGPKSPQNQQGLRLTSSGHEDNSIKQKVRNKKAEFAELKNQMNSLLL